jgi:hypothetical protein
VTLPFPTTLSSGYYELRLMSPDPELPALFQVIARSEPIFIADRPNKLRLVPMREPGNRLRLHLDGAIPDIYYVEATDTLRSPTWKVIATIKKGTPEFVENINPSAPARYYRLSEQ